MQQPHLHEVAQQPCQLLQCEGACLRLQPHLIRRHTGVQGIDRVDLETVSMVDETENQVTVSPINIKGSSRIAVSEATLEL